MKKAIYPGSFDPVTRGHLDIIERASRLFDHLVIGVLVNKAKTPLFSVEERVQMIREAVKDLPNVEVQSFGGLTVDFAKQCEANAVVRGLRAITDFEYELQMALLNRNLKRQCETIFMMPTLKNSFVSSTLVKEVARLGGNFEEYLPAPVAKALKIKLGIKK